jgi:hypothetical protein
VEEWERGWEGQEVRLSNIKAVAACDSEDLMLVVGVGARVNDVLEIPRQQHEHPVSL